MSLLISEYKNYYKTIHHNVRTYFLVLLIAAISNSAYNVLLGIYLKNLGHSEANVGSILSLMTVGVALGALPVSAFAGRFSKKITIVSGLFIMVLSGLAMINLRHLVVIQIAAFIYGIGQASVMILQAPILYENTASKDRVTAFSVAFVLQNVAFVFSTYFLGHASSLLSQTMTELSSLALVLNLATLTQVIAIFLTWQFTGDSMERGNTCDTLKTTLLDTYAGFKSVFKGGALYYIIQVGFIGFGAGLVVPFFSIYLKYTLEVNDATVGTIMAISQLGTILGGLVVSPLSRKFGRVKTVLACQILSIPFLFSISMPQGLIIITLSFFFRSSLMNMANPIISSLSMDIVDEGARTHMSSVVSMTGNLFRALGIFAGGFIMYHVSYNAPYYFTIFFYIVGTYIFYRTFKSVE